MDGNKCALEYMNTVLGYNEQIVCESVSQSISFVHTVQPIGRSIVIRWPSGRQSYGAENGLALGSRGKPQVPG